MLSVSSFYQSRALAIGYIRRRKKEVTPESEEEEEDSEDLEEHIERIRRQSDSFQATLGDRCSRAPNSPLALLNGDLASGDVQEDYALGVSWFFILHNHPSAMLRGRYWRHSVYLL